MGLALEARHLSRGVDGDQRFCGQPVYEIAGHVSCEISTADDEVDGVAARREIQRSLPGRIRAADNCDRLTGAPFGFELSCSVVDSSALELLPVRQGQRPVPGA